MQAVQNHRPIRTGGFTRFSSLLQGESGRAERLHKNVAALPNAYPFRLT